MPGAGGCSFNCWQPPPSNFSSFPFLLFLGGTYTKLGWTAACVLSLKKQFLTPTSTIFKTFIFLSQKGKYEYVFLLFFDTDLCYLVSRLPQRSTWWPVWRVLWQKITTLLRQATSRSCGTEREDAQQGLGFIKTQPTTDGHNNTACACVSVDKWRIRLKVSFSTYGRSATEVRYTSTLIGTLAQKVSLHLLRERHHTTLPLCLRSIRLRWWIFIICGYFPNFFFSHILSHNTLFIIHFSENRQNAHHTVHY